MNNIILFVIIQSLAACVIGWIGIAGTLIAGYVSGFAIIICIAAGFVLAIPVAWVIQRRMTNGPTSP